jgi:uncharacterized protein (TIGR02145 family)
LYTIEPDIYSKQMKKIICIHSFILLNSILGLSLSLKTQAQDFQINFAGSGASSTVDSVKVENLTQCKSISIGGSDILHLIANVGIKDIITPDAKFLQVFPNPTNSDCLLQFETYEKNEVTISLYGLNGKIIFRNKEVLPRDYHSYLLSGISSGTFFIKVETDKYSYVEKLICNNRSSSLTEIKITETTPVSGNNNSNYDLKKPVRLKNDHSIIEMQFTTGDMLKFTGISGLYRTVHMLVPTQSQTLDFIFTGCVDADNNSYPVIQIGTQLWMAENLKTTRYRNGDIIPDIISNAAWANLLTGAYCWYNNDSSANAPVYGALYNWYAINDSRNIAPAGWHVASDSEWTILSDWLGGSDFAGGKLKDKCSTLWNDPNTGATNETGYTALPGGYRFLNGTFDENRNWAVWWCSTSSSSYEAPTRAAFKDGEDLGRDLSNKKDGFAIRCIKD